VPHDTATMGGPEGEIGLPKDPFHAFDGPGTDWPPETQAFPPEKPSESNSTASIDLDAEATRPACSPLHHTSTTQKPALSYSSCVPPRHRMLCFLHRRRKSLKDILRQRCIKPLARGTANVWLAYQHPVPSRQSVLGKPSSRSLGSRRRAPGARTRSISTC
jgi:hypothetical protein